MSGIIWARDWLSGCDRFVSSATEARGSGPRCRPVRSRVRTTALGVCLLVQCEQTSDTDVVSG
jgi:hypothetical protein